MNDERTELGCAGHFIANASCRYRRHTQVPGFRVSTVGDYYLPKATTRTTVGAGPDDYFETMVFTITDLPAKGSDGCGCMSVWDWNAVEVRRYATAGAAHAGHEALVTKYLQHPNHNDRSTP